MIHSLGLVSALPGRPGPELLDYTVFLAGAIPCVAALRGLR